VPRRGDPALLLPGTLFAVGGVRVPGLRIAAATPLYIRDFLPIKME